MKTLAGDVGQQRWHMANRNDVAARRLADRHYNRQKIGAPGFAPPGSCVVFLTGDARAFWVTSAPFAEYVKHEWAGAWICSAFRSEGAGCASELIREAIAATRAFYGDPPPLGMVTFVDRGKVKPTIVRGQQVFGWTFRKAGFVDAGETKTQRLLALQLRPEDMPGPRAAAPRTMHGTPLFDHQEIRPCST
jgi:hypothetical protein